MDPVPVRERAGDPPAAEPGEDGVWTDDSRRRHSCTCLRSSGGLLSLCDPNLNPCIGCISRPMSHNTPSLHPVKILEDSHE